MSEAVEVDPNDNPVRQKVALTAEQIAALEAEKKSLLSRIDVAAPGPAPSGVPRARRAGAGGDDYPDQRAQHEPAPPTREELDAESPVVRAAEAAKYVRAQQRPTFAPGEPHSIESLAAECADAEQRWKDCKARLKKALKRLGVK